MSRSTSQSSTLESTAGNGISRSMSLKATSKSAQNIPPTSNVKLFVTNLRLLDLDLRDDWPGITVQTFSSKNADQKQRISGVEWALFRLFELWDPVETTQKLQPFFPPLEPLQSLNLRAALYRCLIEVKKNGVLGRESVLRKTMLDECKGDKFFEILATFSTAVSKKLLAPQLRDDETAIAMRLSTATALSKSSQASLLPLAIAHKAALRNILRRKEEKRARYEAFERLLNDKADEINRRLVKSKATPRTQKNIVPESEAAAIKKQLKDNWVGNQKWLQVMLHGDDVPSDNAFLDARFKDVWTMVQAGRRLEDALPEPGLLEHLQSRVDEQQGRLQKWKRFHEQLKKDIPPTAPAEPYVRSQEIEMRFDDHLALQLPSSTADAENPYEPNALRPVYQDIIDGMNAELLHISKSKPRRPSAPNLRRSASSISASQSPSCRRKSRTEEVLKQLHARVNTQASKPAAPSRKHSKETLPARPAQHAHHAHAATPVDSDVTLIGQPSTVTRPVSPPQALIEEEYEDKEDEPEREDDHAEAHTSDPLPTAQLQSSRPTTANQPQPEPPSPSPQPSSYWPSEPPLLEPPPMDPEDALAEQIISSIGNATPSPIKKTQPRPSLLERTRMSMARTTSFDAISESLAPPSPPLPELPVVEPAPQLDRRASLLERTRLSMAAMAANPRPQPKKDKRKSAMRQSLFPVNQFDTPRNRKSIAMIEEARSSGGSVTPKEDLFSDGVDYDKVFKSRPRIAQSPIFSPEAGVGVDVDSREQGGEEGGGHGNGHRGATSTPGSGLGLDRYDDYDEGVTGVDLDGVDQGDEDGFTAAWEDSPSRKGR